MAPIHHVYTSPQADVGDPTLVQPSDWNSVHAYSLQDAVSLSGNTAGVLANISTGTLYLAGGNNLTLSQDGNSVTLSAFAQSLQTQSRFNLTLDGNTSGALALISSGVMTLAGGNNVTLSQAGNAVTVSAASQTVQSQSRFNLTLSGNTDGALALISSGVMTLAGGDNITLSQAGNAVTVVGATAGGAGIGTSVEAVASANSVGTVTRYAGEDHRHAGVFSAGVSTGGNTAGDTVVQPGRIVFAGGNNVTLSVGTAANGLQTVTISAANSGTAPPIGTAVKGVSSVGSTGTVTRFAPEDHQHAGVFSAGVSTGGNTAGDTAVLPGRLVLAGGANVTLSMATAAGNLMTVSMVGAAAAGGVIGTSVEAVASASSVGTVTRYAPEDHRHAGLYQISVGGNTAGATTAGAGSLHLAGGPNITLSGATAAGGMTLSVSAAAAGAASARLVYLPTDTLGTTRNLSLSMSTLFIVPVIVPSDMTIDRIVMLNSMATNVSSNASNTTWAFTISRGVALYSYNGTSLAMASSSSAAPAISYTSNISTESLSGRRLHSLPLPATLTPGNWWVAFSYSSIGNRSAAGGSSNTTMNNSYFIGLNYSTLEDLHGPWAEAADTFYRVTPFQGYYSVSSGAFPGSIAHSQVSQSDSVNLWFRLQGAISG